MSVKKNITSKKYKEIEISSFSYIEKIAELLKKKNLTKIEINKDGVSINVENKVTVIQESSTLVPSSPQIITEKSKPTSEDKLKNANKLNSPMVGTVYLSPQPGSLPFIKIGDEVKKGQTVLIIEAMKIMNQIPMHDSGVVKKILVKNEDLVEYNQPLIIIE